MTETEILQIASTIRDPDARQTAILALLEALQAADANGTTLTLTEAETIARRASYKAERFVRGERRRSVSLEVIADPDPDSRPTTPTGAIATAYKLLHLLPEKPRRAFLLHHVSGYSVVDTAEQMGVTRQTVARWLNAAKKIFAAHVPF